MNTSKRFGKFAMLFLFLLTCLGSSIPVSAEAEEEPEVLTAIASADVFFSGFLIAEGDTLELEESQYCLEESVSYLTAYNDDGGEALGAARAFVDATAAAVARAVAAAQVGRPEGHAA